MTPPTSPIRTRMRRLARNLTVAAAVGVGAGTVGVATLGAAPVAQAAAQPTFDEVSARAGAALVALDEFEATGDARDLVRYRRQRNVAAALTADYLGYPGIQMVAAWGTAPGDHQRAVLSALTQLGVPYRYATSEPGVGFDCSGLTSFAWRSAGHELVRQSSSQIREAAPLERGQAKPGDLAQYPGHVMMYLGVGNAVVHSVTHGRTVELDHISERKASSVRFGDPTV